MSRDDRSCRDPRFGLSQISWRISARHPTEDTGSNRPPIGRHLAGLLGETAVAAGKTQTREGARYRRIARRRGKARAQVALGNTLLKVYHKLPSSPGTRYEDLGPDYYERQATTRRQIAHHVGKLAALGFEVTLARIPTPDPAGPASNAA